MRTIHQVKALRSALHERRNRDQRIALIPTMGSIHEGHLKLVDQALSAADCVVVSIYVNPTQFNRADDFAAYPRTLEGDSRLLAERGAHLLFAPSDDEMYPGGLNMLSYVDVAGISEPLEGVERPGHFRGVATVVSKLFNMVGPDVAIFGQKDYQQLAVIQTLVRELAFPLSILPAPTARADSGLALSSRNSRLSESQLQLAPELYRSLSRIGEALEQGERDFQSLCQTASDRLAKLEFRVEYLEVRTPKLTTPCETDSVFVVLIAAWLGNVRLIDNLVVTTAS
ncbi:MAG: pantoate--beta-alanine ligase [Gammaproteobacteria bacterium]|nr:pantoate--beta-alanine ligase [Gammaproteobacteria bacterium]